MSEMEVLRELYEETMDRVFACSANYRMTIARKGMEKEHSKYCQRAEVLENMMETVGRLQQGR